MNNNFLWPANTALWRKLLAIALLPPALLFLLIMLLGYTGSYLVYQAECWVDGRPNFPSFKEWISWMWEIN